MNSTSSINKFLPESEIYEILLPRIEALINSGEPLISNLSNVTAALKEAFDKISWVGFYFLHNGKLYLGPFQGKPACTVIEAGKGVCGAAVKLAKSVIVENVDSFPGHIACDSGSRSEIVIPIAVGNVILGVLDLDSYFLSAFNETDKLYLEKLSLMLTEKLVFNYLDPIIKY